MSYQVLARKWRPRRFSELVGQEHVVRALSNALDSDRMHHAFLFTGTRGVGKTTIARIFAKSLNCERGQSSDPCGECAACKDIDAGRFMDLIEIDAASNTGVDDVRELIENAQYSPSRGRFKVYLIDEVHMLSKSAFNALLKTLEEPPDHVKFLLATTDPQKLPVTVLSRCLKFNLKRLLPEQISGQMRHILDQEGTQYDAEALDELARGADGSLRDGLSLLDQAIAYGAGSVHAADVRQMLGTIERSRVFALIAAAAAGDGQRLMAEVESLAEFSPDYAGVLDDIAAGLHRLQLRQLVPGHVDMDQHEDAQVAELSERLAPEVVQLFYQMAVIGRRDLSLAPTPRAGFEMTLLRMLAFRPGNPGDKIAAAAPPAKAAVSPPVARSGGVRETPASKPPRTNGRQDEPAATGSDDWQTLIQQAGLLGPVGQLAQHAALLGIENGVVRLALKPEFEHLKVPPLIEQMAERLSTALGRSLKVRFEKREKIGETPADVALREREQQQQAAERALGEDPFVQSLIRDFDARVIPESIRPASTAAGNNAEK